jgi:hypothetical protein
MPLTSSLACKLKPTGQHSDTAPGRSVNDTGTPAHTGSARALACTCTVTYAQARAANPHAPVDTHGYTHTDARAHTLSTRTVTHAHASAHLQPVYCNVQATSHCTCAPMLPGADALVNLRMGRRCATRMSSPHHSACHRPGCASAEPAPTRHRSRVAQHCEKL